MSIARDDRPRLLELVEQALDVPDSERAAWVGALSLPTPLREALHGLLVERRALETGGFLGALPVLEGQRPPGEEAGRLAPGTAVGPWRLVRELGQGGMIVS